MYNVEYMYDTTVEEIKKLEKKYTFRTDRLKVIHCKNGIIMPPVITDEYGTKACGGVCDEEGMYVQESAQYVSGVSVVGGGYLVEKEIPYIDEEVVYLGKFNAHWGHFLMDMLTRVWYICDNREHYIAYSMMNENICVKGTYWELFEILGMKREQLYMVKRPTRFRNIIIPEESFVWAQYATKEFIKTFDFIKDKVRLRRKTYDKVYFARTKEAECGGEADIVKHFRQQGYKIVYPLKLSLREQIWYWKTCKCAVVSSGSMAHNIVFAQDGIELIVINVDWMNSYQVMLNKLRNVKATYVDCQFNLLPYRMPRVFFPTQHYIDFMKNTFDYEVKIDPAKEYKKLNNLFMWWLVTWNPRDPYMVYLLKEFDKGERDNLGGKNDMGKYYLESRRDDAFWRKVIGYIKTKL